MRAISVLVNLKIHSNNQFFTSLYNFITIQEGK